MADEEAREMLRRAAANNPGSPLAQGALVGLSKAERREARRAAEEAAQPPVAAEPVSESTVDPIVAAQELLARGDEIDASFGEFRTQRDAALRREQDALQTYRKLLRHHRSRINDAKWCATSKGREVMTALTALREEIDRLNQITPGDPDYALLWRIRIAAEFQADFTTLVLAASEPIVTASGKADPILVVINREQKREMQETSEGERKSDAVEEKFFFRADGKIFFPNGYERRLEVQRVVRELQQLRYRVDENYKRERSEAEALLKAHAPDRTDASGTPLDLVTLLSVDKPSPYEGRVDVALYFGGFKFVPPSEMQQRPHRGVVHLSVQNMTDSVTGKPAKLVTLHAVVGNIERTLPAVGSPPWSIELTKYGDGEMGLRKGFNHPDDKPPLAHLRHVQQILWLANERKLTVGQVLGLAEFQQYEAWRQKKYRKPHRKGGGKPKPTQQAQGAAAPAAESSAETTAPAGTGTPDATATGGTGPAPGGKPKRKRDRGPKADAASGGNGVPAGATATPAPTGDEPSTT
ncbi:MAG: hypothetical protein Q7R80_05195 [bacterium]|nr:hypothetical protein [bacterium]